MTLEALSLEALNRALLARQHLLVRAPASVPGVVEHLVGLQAQEPKDPYVALWSRVRGFRVVHLDRLIKTRQLVRLTLMRGTIHLVTVRDAFALRRVIQPVLDRMLLARRRGYTGVDLDTVAEEGHAILARQPQTYAELGKRLGEKWPDNDPEALSRVVQVRVPLVQVPPRGLWSTSGAARHAPLDTWIRTNRRSVLDLEHFVLRYLAAFGPASVRDAQAWCGLSRLAAVFDRLGNRLDRFSGPDGTILYDVPSAPRPGPDVAAPPRFLPYFENLILGLHDRSRILGPLVPRFPSNTFVRFVSLDGMLGATWKLRRSKDQVTLVVEPFVPVSSADRTAIQEEGARLLDSFEADSKSRCVEIAVA